MMCLQASILIIPIRQCTATVRSPVCCERPRLCPWHRMAGCRIDVNASLVACLLGDPGFVNLWPHFGLCYQSHALQGRKSSFPSPTAHDRPKLLPAAHQPVRGACVEVRASTRQGSGCARCLRSRHAQSRRQCAPQDLQMWQQNLDGFVVPEFWCHSYAAWLYPPHPGPFMLHSYHPRAPFQGVRRSIIATPPRASAFDASSGQTTTTTTTSDSNCIKPELNGGWAGSGSQPAL